jgi:UDP-N-acetylglucosamine--N-acetylmuramyl-(pentapeptide) pyrophosphoryl-undecaprenol N-acetylglucosamine transferase
MKHIVLTGGGTAGHVTPNIALIPYLKKDGFNISYIGSFDGIEKQLISEMGISYYGISSGKLRRYMSLKNVSDIFRVLKGMSEAKSILKKLKPDIIFSKGGFVSVPVVRAAKSLGIPVIIHESDMTPGLANKLSFPAASAVCCNFPETAKYLPEDKAVVTGTPIRNELMHGDPEAARSFCGFDSEKPVLLAIGGSLGSAVLNDAIRESLPVLLEHFQIIHLCGQGKIDSALTGTKGYVQYEYIKKELSDMFALAEVIVSRAGANSISEICALAKPNLLIPLSAKASRGDQILNARSFEKQGFSMVIEEEELTAEKFQNSVMELYENRQQYIDAMKASPNKDSISIIMGLINKYTK